MHQYIGRLRNRLFDPEYPIRTIGYLISFVLLVIFTWGDMVILANTLNIFGLLQIVPQVLEPSVIPIAFSMFFGPKIGSVVFLEIRSNPSMLTRWSVQTERAKRTGLVLSFLIFLLSVVIFIGYWIFIRGFFEGGPIFEQELTNGISLFLF